MEQFQTSSKKKKDLYVVLSIFGDPSKTIRFKEFH